MTCEVRRSIQKTGGTVQKSLDLFQEQSMRIQCSPTCQKNQSLRKKNWSVCKRICSFGQRDWSICKKNFSIRKKNWSICLRNQSICKKKWTVCKRDSCGLNDEKTEFEQGLTDKLANAGGTHAKARTNPHAKPKLRHQCRTHPSIVDKLVRVNREIEFGCPRALH